MEECRPPDRDARHRNGTKTGRITDIEDVAFGSIRLLVASAGFSFLVVAVAAFLHALTSENPEKVVECYGEDGR